MRHPIQLSTEDIGLLMCAVQQLKSYDRSRKARRVLPLPKLAPETVVALGRLHDTLADAARQIMLRQQGTPR